MQTANVPAGTQGKFFYGVHAGVMSIKSFSRSGCNSQTRQNKK